MEISKLLLIDVALAIAATPLIFFFKRRKKTLPIAQSSNNEKLLKQITFRPPSKEKLLDLERLAKREGSGIDFDLLFGVWKFASVWKKDTDDEDYFFSSLLRFFSASLELKKNIPNENLNKFSIVAAIHFGLFSIEFSGSGYFKGKQPLLKYFFNLIELKFDSTILLSRSLKEQIEKEEPFFALIASEESGEWLAARGQGGALVLWLQG